MTPDIQATITRLKELDQKASPAPWGLETWSGINDEESTALEDARGNPVIGNGYDPLDGSEEIDLVFITQLRNAAPALIADHESTARKLAIYEKRMAYIAKNYPLVHADALEHAPEQEN